MRKFQRQVLAAMSLAAAGLWSPQAFALEGDERLACEAILCLAASARPAECAPSIRRFFSISHRKFSDTLRGRLNFLNLCPIVSQPNMGTLRDALVHGSGRCDAASINQVNFISWGEGEGRVGNHMPGYCQTLFGNEFVQGKAPQYVGEPQHGGHWVEAVDYPAALAEYNRRRAEEIRAQEEANRWGGN